MDKIKEKFSSIHDTRHQSYVEHKLSDILVITMCAVLNSPTVVISLKHFLIFTPLSCICLVSR